MIARAAVATSVAAECLLVYCVAEIFAAGYDNHQRAMPALSWIIVGLCAFALPLALNWFAVGGNLRVLLSVAGVFLVIDIVMRIEFAGDIAFWNLAWAKEFVQNSQEVAKESGPVFITIMLVIGLWARCAYRAAQEVELEFMARTLAPSFMIVTALVILGAMTDRTGEVGRGAVAFYGVAVLSLAFSQLSLSGATIGDIRAGGVTGALMGGVAAVTIAGVVAFALVFGFVWPIVGPIIVDVVAVVFTAILAPPAWLLTWLFDLILPDSVGSIDIEIATIRDEAGEAPSEEESTASRVSGYAMRTTALLVVLGAAALAAIAFQAFKKRMAQPAQASISSTSAGSLGEELRDLFRNMFRRGHHGDRAVDDEVGRLYREVLDHAEAAGRPREQYETPLEFAPVAHERLHMAVTDDITAAFVQARYAGRAPDPALLVELERRWHEMKRDEDA